MYNPISTAIQQLFVNDLVALLSGSLAGKMSVLPFVRGVDFSRNEFKVSLPRTERASGTCPTSDTRLIVHTVTSCLTLQKDQFMEKMGEMRNLRWLRLNRSQLGALPDEIDQFQKLVIKIHVVITPPPPPHPHQTHTHTLFLLSSRRF